MWCEDIYVQGIPYVTMFTELHNSVVDVSYSMLLGKSWFKDARVTHDQGNNIVTIQGNGMVQKKVTKHLGAEVKRPKMLLCCAYQNGITDMEEDIIFAT